MRLLFDQNLSRFLVVRLADLFPGSQHVLLVGLEAASDSAVWAYARHHGFVLVTKDADFLEFSRNLGRPPPLVLLTLGNCTTAKVEELFRHRFSSIAALVSSETGLLILP